MFKDESDYELRAQEHLRSKLNPEWEQQRRIHFFILGVKGPQPNGADMLRKLRRKRWKRFGKSNY